MALGTTALASLALGLPASAQQFPDRTITLRSSSKMSAVLAAASVPTAWHAPSRTVTRS